jgi:CRISPR-associated protein Csm3
MPDLSFSGRVRIEGTILLQSGLHIGAGKDTIEIGGIDNPVIKHPHTGEPYIPGSSLKGKLRFLLEWAFQPLFQSVRQDGKPWGCDDKQSLVSDDPVLRIFGTAAKRDKWTGGPTRLIVRDAFLAKDWLDEHIARGDPLTEEKTEVVIDRIAGKAHQIGPRHTERVPAGARLDFQMVFRMFDTGDGGARDRDCLNWLLAGLHLLEQDALGGSGSRGYGRVRFEDLKVFGDGIEEQRIDNVFRVARFDPAHAPSIVAFAP